MKKILNYFGYFKENFLFEVSFELVGFFMGFFLNVFGLAKLEDKSLFTFGSLMAAVWLLLCAFFCGMVFFYQKFNVAVAMGCTRKAFLGWYILTSVVFQAIDMLILYILYHLEKGVYTSLFPEKELAGILDWLFRPQILILLILAGVVFKFFVGMFTLRFGKNGFIVLWGGYLVLCLTFSRLCSVMSQNPDGNCAAILRGIVRMISAMNGMGGYILGYVIMAVLFIVSARLTLKQEVRSA